MKIAFLFLIINDINFPDIWENYFKGYEGKYSVYCHPKNSDQVQTRWLRDNIIDNIVETGWGYIVDAYSQLLTHAYQNEENIKFITISESCVPLIPFDDLYNMLTADLDRSYVKYMKISKYDLHERIQVNEGYGKYKFIKHYARFCLSRYHVNKLLVQTEGLDFFKNMHIGDEFFLSLLDAEDNIENMAITFDNWEFVVNERKRYKGKIRRLYEKIEELPNPLSNKGKKIKGQIDAMKQRVDDFSKNPKTYNHITEYDIIEIIDSGCFFWRKISKKSNIRDFYRGNTCCLK